MEQGVVVPSVRALLDAEEHRSAQLRNGTGLATTAVEGLELHIMSPTVDLGKPCQGDRRDTEHVSGDGAGKTRHLGDTQKCIWTLVVKQILVRDNGNIFLPHHRQRVSCSHLRDGVSAPVLKPKPSGWEGKSDTKQDFGLD
eukprot:gene9968-biopygen7073